MQDFKTRELLNNNFGISTDYWYPLTGGKAPNNCEYFDVDVFITNYGLERLIQFIKNLGYSIINEIVESLEDKKIEVEDLDSYCGLETFYCNDNGDWAIYFSHENTVTFIVAEFLGKLKIDWPDWEYNKDPWNINNGA